MVLEQSHFPCTPEGNLPGACIARQVMLLQKEAGAFHSFTQLFISSTGSLLSIYLLPVILEALRSQW